MKASKKSPTSTVRVVTLPILSRTTVAEGTTEIKCSTTGTNFEFKSGQYIRITLPQLSAKVKGGNTRDFTISSSPNTKNVIAITFRDSKSAFKKKLLSLPLKSKVAFQGPLGVFTLPSDSKIPLVFIAGGIGVTTFLSMIRYAHENKTGQKITLVYVNSNQKRAAYLKELQAIAKQNSTFILLTPFERIDTEYLKKNVPYTQKTLWYICGPSAMVLTLAAEIPKNLTVLAANIRTEEYVGYNKKLGYTVYPPVQNEVKRLSEKEALVVAGTSLLTSTSQAALIAITDIQGTIMYVNQKFIEVSQYSFNELIGQNHRILKSGFHPSEFYESLWKTISSGRIWRGEIKNRAKDGSFYWVDTTISPVFENTTITGYLAVRFLVTDKKIMELQLKEENEATLNILEDVNSAKKMLEKSQREIKKLALVVEHLNDMVYIADPKTLVPEYINPAVKEMYGITADVFLKDANKWGKSIHPDDKERVLQHFAELRKSKQNGRIEYRIIHKDKSVKDIVDVSTWLLDEDGTILNLIGTVRDITEEKLLHEKIIASEQRLKTIFENTSDAIFLIDIDHWSIIDFNMQAQLLSGYSADQILKLPVLQLFTKDQSSIIGRLLQNCTIGMRSSVIETELRNINDEIISVECSISTADVEGTNYVIASFRDIREKKGAIAERERLQKTREQIFINTSHELKTPLTSIMMQTEMLANNELGALTSVQKESIELILRNVQRFNALITAILDISKINSGSITLSMKKINVNKIVEMQCKNFKLVAEQLNVKLINNIKNINIVWDQSILKRIFTILIENAIKFSKGGSVTINAKSTADGVEVSVSDTGIGIDKKNFNKIFEPFFQVSPSYSLSNKGTGLGLSIAKSLVKKYGGRIWVESKGKGSTFKFTIPLKIKAS